MQHLLIVDDDADISSTLKEVLEDEGYDVHCEPNGEQALGFLKKQTQLPDLILLDLMMPVMDGFEFRAHQIASEELSKIPVIVMSAGIKVDSENFISKPIHLSNLLTKIGTQI